MPSEDRDFVRSIERGFAVLLAFDEERPTASLSELATATDLSRPAVRRILLTLQRLGYVTGGDGRWSLTPRVLSIGQHYSSSHAMIDAAMPYLVQIAEHTEESASLGVRDGTDVVYAARVPVRRIMSINVSVGTRVPAYATSMGRALLAWAGDDVVDDVIAQTRFDRLATGTVRNAEELRAELATVRRRGFAMAEAELEDGLISLAAPVRDRSAEVVGVLACSTSAGRNTLAGFRDHVAPLLVEFAVALSRDLGHRA